LASIKEKSKKNESIDLLLVQEIDDDNIQQFYIDKNETKLYHFFTLMSDQKVHLLGSDDESEISDWISKINKEIRGLRRKTKKNEE